MPSPLIYLAEGSRIFLNSWKQRILPKKYEGTAEEICKQIVKDCWNGRYFQTSTGNFSQFWTRDFGWCTQGLLRLGYQKEVHHTLRYAINRFKSAKKITTAITPWEKPFDFPYPAVDSLPWLLHSIHLAKFPIYDLKGFLNAQVEKYFHNFIDVQTGLVKPELHVSSMKDLALRKSSCYDNCMVGMLAQDIAALELKNPFEKYDYSSLIHRHFWNGAYFFDDLTKKPYLAGDAQVFPFITGLCKNKEMLEKTIKKVQEAGLDVPFPLKYTAKRNDASFVMQELLLYNYEGSSIWTHMGPLWIKLVKEVDTK
ncbi:hypothetical protein HYX13_03020, partial [Candidatus Woesearchaeota archaeon]|nr:hypothetical protein [Candidatus Woesearchaeota archaeon]